MRRRTGEAPLLQEYLRGEETPHGAGAYSRKKRTGGAIAKILLSRRIWLRFQRWIYFLFRRSRSKTCLPSE